MYRRCVSWCDCGDVGLRIGPRRSGALKHQLSVVGGEGGGRYTGRYFVHANINQYIPYMIRKRKKLLLFSRPNVNLHSPSSCFPVPVDPFLVQTPRTISTLPKELLAEEKTAANAKLPFQIASATEKLKSDTTAAPERSLAYDHTIAGGVVVAGATLSDDEKYHGRMENSESAVAEKRNHTRIQDSESTAAVKTVDDSDGDDGDYKERLSPLWLNPTGERAVEPWKTLMGISWPAGIQTEFGTVFCHRWKDRDDDSLAGVRGFGKESAVHRAWGTTMAAKAILTSGRGASGSPDPAPGSLLGTIIRLIAGVTINA